MCNAYVNDIDYRKLKIPMMQFFLEIVITSYILNIKNQAAMSLFTTFISVSQPIFA